VSRDKVPVELLRLLAPVFGPVCEDDACRMCVPLRDALVAILRRHREMVLAEVAETVCNMHRMRPFLGGGV